MRKHVILLFFIPSNLKKQNTVMTTCNNSYEMEIMVSTVQTFMFFFCCFLPNYV